MQRKTEQAVDQLRQHFNHKSYPDDGLPYADALFAIDPDQTNQSLERLNTVLTQLHQQQIRPNDILQQDGGINFLMMVALYLCDVISARTGYAVEWYNYHEAIKKLPSDFGLPEDFFSSMVAIIKGEVCLPLGLISDILYGIDSEQRNCLSYVIERCKVIDNDQQRNVNEWCKVYLDALYEKKYVPGGNFYRQLTDCITFDDSLTSVQEIDCVLASIRLQERLSPDSYNTFVANQEKSNFLLAISFYLGMLIAKHTKNPVKWFSFKEYQQQFSSEPDLTYRIEYHQVFAIDNTISYPIAVLTEILFDPQPEQSCLKYVQKYIAAHQGYIHYIPSQVSLTIVPDDTISEPLRNTMASAGLLAAQACFMIHDGSAYISTLLTPKPDGLSFVKLMYDNPLHEGMNQLDNNPNQLPYQIFSDDIYAYLPTGRTDAILLEIRMYQPEEFSLTLVIPYQKKTDFDEFKIFSAVRYSKTSLNAAQFEAAMAAFYAAAFEFISPFSKSSLWQEYFEERLPELPDQSLAAPEFLQAQQQRFQAALSAQITAAETPEQQSDAQKSSTPLDNALSQLDIAAEIAKLPRHYRSYLQVIPPDWMIGDALYRQIEAMPALYLKGRVVWAALIQANKLMFEPQGANCPGEILFDPTGQTEPAELVRLAHQLFRLKGTAPAQADQFEYAQHLTNEVTRVVNHPFPQSIAPLPLRISSIWFWRFHLPNGMLSLSYFPILIDEEKGSYAGEAMILPSWFWPKTVRETWLNTAKERLGVTHDLSESIFKSLQQYQSIIPNINPQHLKPALSLLFQDELSVSHQSFNKPADAKTQLSDHKPSANLGLKNPVRHDQTQPRIGRSKSYLSQNNALHWSQWMIRILLAMLGLIILISFIVS